MNLNDITKPLTAEDLIRRYNLEGLRTDRKNINSINQSIKRQNNIIKNYVKNIIPYKSQAKNTITAWFFNGVPEEVNDSMINDLCFDRDTGYIYQLIKGDENFEWQRIENEELTTSLSYANSDADTFDNKRTLFLEEPTPPYDAGDIWLKDNEIMRCRCSRSEGNYNSVDWIIQEDYTEDCVLSETRAILNDLKTTVETDYTTTVQLESTKDSILARVESDTKKIETNLNNNYYNKEQLDYMGNSNIQNITEVKNSVENLTTSTSQSIKIIEEKFNNGVSQVRTENNFTFDKNGLHLDELGAPVKNTLDAYGMEIVDKTGSSQSTQFFSGYVTQELVDKNPNLAPFLGQTITYTNDIYSRNFIKMQNGRWENTEHQEYGPGIGAFIGGDS